MTSISLNQTESEKRLNRILWLVKFLRALIVHCILILLAIGLYMAFGIAVLYPVVISVIDFLRAHQADSDTMAISVIFIVLLFLLIIAFFVWLYLSITRVKRKSVKVLAIFTFALCILWLPVSALSFLFSYNHLDPLFTILFGIFVAFYLWWYADVSIGLWKVSTSPDVYSFVATLDPRLTQGIWAHFNKLLDLPRTPLRTWRNGAAYLLSFGSYILLIASLMYFLTFGYLQTKLTQLQSECNPENMPLCAMQSSAFAKHIGLWIILAFIGARLAILVQSGARKLSSLSVGKALGDSKQRYILYLRSFTADETILPKPRLPLLSKVLSLRPFPYTLKRSSLTSRMDISR